MATTLDELAAMTQRAIQELVARRATLKETESRLSGEVEQLRAQLAAAGIEGET